MCTGAGHLGAQAGEDWPWSLSPCSCPTSLSAWSLRRHRCAQPLIIPSFNLALHKDFRSTCLGRESGEQGKASAFIEMTFSGTANHQVNTETNYDPFRYVL